MVQVRVVSHPLQASLLLLRAILDPGSSTTQVFHSTSYSFRIINDGKFKTIQREEK